MILTEATTPTGFSQSTCQKVGAPSVSSQKKQQKQGNEIVACRDFPNFHAIFAAKAVNLNSSVSASGSRGLFVEARHFAHELFQPAVVIVLVELGLAFPEGGDGEFELRTLLAGFGGEGIGVGVEETDFAGEGAVG